MAKPKGFLTGTDSPTRDGREQLAVAATAVHRGGLRVGCPSWNRMLGEGKPRGQGLFHSVWRDRGAGGLCTPAFPAGGTGHTEKEEPAENAGSA